jgi:hypothetical protein
MGSSRQKGTKAAAPSPAQRVVGDRILGDHPAPPHAFGELLTAKDGRTTSKVPHRALAEKAGSRAAAVKAFRAMLVQHHASPEALERTEKHREAMKRLGLDAEQARIRRFPTNTSTQKGNLAEIVLAEYVVAASSVVLPVYRLRYNPNVDQSMKGDDVLAFDLDSDPVRLVVGEAKFRGASSAAAVTEIVEGLLRSHKGGIPASLQFVADRLFEEGKPEIGKRILECALLFARNRLRLEYVGLLLSDTQAAARIDASTPPTPTRLAVISLSVDDPDGLVASCYEKLE